MCTVTCIDLVIPDVNGCHGSFSASGQRRLGSFSAGRHGQKTASSGLPNTPNRSQLQCLALETAGLLEGVSRLEKRRYRMYELVQGPWFVQINR